MCDRSWKDQGSHDCRTAGRNFGRTRNHASWSTTSLFESIRLLESCHCFPPGHPRQGKTFVLLTPPVGLERRPGSPAPAALANYQHFPDVVAGEKELDGSEIVEKILDVPVVEDAL